MPIHSARRRSADQAKAIHSPSRTRASKRRGEDVVGATVCTRRELRALKNRTGALAGAGSSLSDFVGVG